MTLARLQIRSGLALVAVSAITIAWLWPRNPHPKFLRTNLTISANGEARRVILCSPLSESKKPLPLILAFHGVGDKPEIMLSYSQLSEFASDGHCYVAFPSARRGMWDTETPSEDWVNENRDAQFFRQTLETLKRRAAIDSDRIYVVGMSNGATFAEMLSLAMPCEIAATVGVAGGLPNRSLKSETNRRVPMLLIAGDSDETGAARWIRTTAEQLHERGHLVEVQILDGIKHEWATGQNEEIWRFLKEQRLPRECE